MDHRNSCRHFNTTRLLFGLGAAASLCVALPARADEPRYDEGTHESRRDRDQTRTHIAVDFDYAAAIDTPDTSDGGGGALRLGQELDLFLVSLTPEIGGGYHSFTGDTDARLYSGFLGGRFAIGKIVEPSVFGHVGVGHVSGFESRTAPVMDAGLAIDFTLLPLIDLGLHGAYNVMLPRNDSSALKFVSLGAQAALVL
jgi:hypothetical protein